MPLVRVAAGAHHADPVLKAIADGVHRALVDAIKIPEGDRFQIVDGAS